MKEVFAIEWLGINFKEVAKSSNQKLPDKFFYESFYSRLDEKYGSVEHLPKNWIQEKRKSSEYLSDILKSVSAKKVLSIGSGLRLIENFIATNDSSIKFYCEDMGSIRNGFITDHKNVIPIFFKDIENHNYDLIYINNVDYALTDEVYYELLTSLKSLHFNHIFISDIFLQEKMTIRNILGHKLKKFLGWQLWGYIRKLNEHKKIFQEVGLNILKEGADERGRQFFLLTRGNHL